jgi:hypothetical protein
LHDADVVAILGQTVIKTPPTSAVCSGAVHQHDIPHRVVRVLRGKYAGVKDQLGKAETCVRQRALVETARERHSISSVNLRYWWFKTFCAGDSAGLPRSLCFFVGIVSFLSSCLQLGIGAEFFDGVRLHLWQPRPLSLSPLWKRDSSR